VQIARRRGREPNCEHEIASIAAREPLAAKSAFFAGPSI
jgi:hypothetical protein